MSVLARFRSWLRAMTRRPVLEQEMDAELRFHIENYVQDLMHRGVSREEAMRRSRLELGGLETQKEAMRASLGLRLWDELWADLRYAVRMLRKSPGFTAIAVGSLALGIGANTGIFTVAKKVLFDTLPVKDPYALRMLTWVSGHEQPVPPLWGDVYSTESGGLQSTSFSYPVLEELRKKTDVFQDLFAFKDVDLTANADGHPELVAAEMVSGNTFHALGLEPALGRFFLPEDDAGAGKDPVAVISEGYWEKHFGRSNTAIGKTVSVNGVPLTIVGVSPARFTGLQIGGAAQIFVPLTMQPVLIPKEHLAGSGNASLLENPQSWWVLVMARLRPDVSEARAQAVLDVVLRQTAMTTLPKTEALEQLHLKLEPGDRGLDYLRGDFAKPSYVLLALAGLVLLLACVNLANLLLARAAARQREMSTRLALGAGRSRILRQMLTESLLLSSLGGAAGLVLSYLGRNMIPRLLANPATTIQVDFDWRVLAFTMTISLTTGVLFGAIPAWQAMRAAVNSSLKDVSHVTADQHKMWLSKGLVAFQITLSMILLIGAGLFVRTLVNLNRMPLGFRSDHILLFHLNPPRSRYSDAQMTSLYRQLEERFAAIPGVRSVSMSNIAIIGDGYSGSIFHISGRPVRKDADRVQMNGVGADYFQTMGIPVLQGRGFDVHDTARAPRVAVVNHALARQFFGNENPIGQTFDGDADNADGPIEIVGMVADTRYVTLRSETPPTYYVPYEQQSRSGRKVVEIRTAAEPGGILSQLRAIVESLDRDLPLIDVRTMTEQIKTSLSGERIFARLTGGFGLLALLLACIGIYGVMAYTVARRVNEIGIRMALGAQAHQVLMMILRESSWLAVIGVAVGLGAALFLTRFLQTMLYGLKPYDPPTLIGAAVLLFAVAVLAGWGPARRASRVDPMQALRHE